MKDRIALLACFVISFLFFGDAFFGDRTLVPAGDLYKREPWHSEFPEFRSETSQSFDQVFQFFPWADFFKDTIGRGEIPLWNPYTYLGTPFFANPQTALLFPLTWIHLVLPLERSFTLIFALKLMLSLLGMYLFLRNEELGPEASFVGAVIFSFSMHTVTSLPYPYSNVTVVFPWALLTVKRLIVRYSVFNMAFGTLSLTLLVFAGQPQSALTACFFLGLFAVLNLKEHSFPPRKVFPLLSAFVISALMSAVQWLPSYEYFRESMVGAGPRIIKSGLPYPLDNLINFVVPNFFGSDRVGDFWGFPGYPDISFYSSAVVLLMVPAAIFTGSKVKKGLFWFLVLTFVISFGVIFGIPLFENLLDLPGFNLMRRNKFVFLMIFSVAGLAAIGSETSFHTTSFQDDSHSKYRARKTAYYTLFIVWVAILGAFLNSWNYLKELDLIGTTILRSTYAVTLLFLALTTLLVNKGWLSARVLLPILVTTDLVILSHGLNPRGSARALFPMLGMTEEVKGDVPRVYALDDIFPPNTNLVYRFQDVRGYDVMTPHRLFRFCQRIDPGLGNAYSWLVGIDTSKVNPQTRLRTNFDKAIRTYGSELVEYLKTSVYWSVSVSHVQNAEFLKLLNMQYLFLRTSRPPPGYLYQGDYGKSFSIYINPGARRAKFYTRWIEVSADNALEWMKTIDLEKEVVVEAELPAPTAAEASYNISDNGTGLNSTLYEVKTDQSGVLVEFNRFHPGWKAYVNGEPREVFPVNFLFRGVFLSPGHHVIELKYEPQSIHYGLYLSLAGCFVLIAFCVLWKARMCHTGTERG